MIERFLKTYIKTTQQNITRGKTRQKRQDMTQQDKISPQPSHSHHSLPESKTDYISAHSSLFLFKLSTNAHMPVFHPQTPLPTLSVLCVLCCNSAHTRHERLSTSSSGYQNVKREETKNGDAKKKGESAFILNGDSYHVFHFHQPSPLPTQLPPAFPPLPTQRHETRRKSLRCRGIFVRLKQPE